MKIKFMSLFLMSCLFITSFTIVASATESEEQKDYIVVTRATGAVEKYEIDLDDFTSVQTTESNISDSEQYFMPESSNKSKAQAIPDDSDYFLPNDSAQADMRATRSTTKTFNWDCEQGYVTYSNSEISLNRGDTISYLFSVSEDYYLRVGVWDRDEDEFKSHRIFAGNAEDGTIDDEMTMSSSVTVSFAIENFGDSDITCSGAYVY